MENKVKGVLDQIRPLLQRDGGDLEFISYDAENKIVKVRLQGACSGCPGAQMTLKGVIENILKQVLPDDVYAVEQA